jgi:hypothetical protein
VEGCRLRKRYERILDGEHPLRAAGRLWTGGRRRTEESVLIMLADAHGPPSDSLTLDNGSGQPQTQQPVTLRV